MFLPKRVKAGKIAARKVQKAKSGGPGDIQ